MIKKVKIAGKISKNSIQYDNKRCKNVGKTKWKLNAYFKRRHFSTNIFHELCLKRF